MAVQTNGHAVTNGSAKRTSYKRTALKPRKKPARTRGSVFAYVVVSLAIRLAFWYSLVTILFRCPRVPTALDESSPRICKPYLDTRSRVAPYVAPYYNAYAAPYVDKARSYAVSLDHKVVAPAVDFGRRSYDSYASMHVQHLRDYGETAWQHKLRPKVDAFTADAGRKYNETLAPQVAKAVEVAAPYYSAAREQLLHTYHSHVVTAYDRSLPYAQHAYTVGQSLVDQGLVYIRTVWRTISAVINRTVWPRLRILYGENVEPQLTRIGERLERYRDRKKVEAVVEAADRSIQASSTTLSAVSAASSAAQRVTSSSSRVAKDDSSQAALTADAEEEHVRRIIDSDLRKWQEKFAKASDKGAEELGARVQEITDRQIANQVHGVGAALVIELEETVKTHIEKAKKSIRSTIEALPQNPTKEQYDEAQEAVHGAIRSAGLAIKAKAQAWRSWRGKWQEELQRLVTEAAQSTLAVIDNIRDLGLQEIGMKWAWMEGVTYKDWARYHTLKDTFDGWRQEVLDVAVRHDGVGQATAAADAVEDRAMDVAEGAAKELARLRSVGRWKLEMRDASDDFSNRYAPPAVAKAGQAVVDGARTAAGAVHAKVGGPVERLASAASQQLKDASASVSARLVASEQQQQQPGVIERATSALSEKVLGTPQPQQQPPLPASLYAAGSAKIVGAAAQASGAVADGAHGLAHAAGAVRSAARSGAADAASALQGVASDVSAAVLGTSSPTTATSQPVLSSASASLESLVSEASQALFGDTTSTTSS